MFVYLLYYKYRRLEDLFQTKMGVMLNGFCNFAEKRNLYGKERTKIVQNSTL